MWPILNPVLLENSAYFILIGYLLGLSLAAPPGPVNAVILNESTKSAFHGTSVGAGAMTADLFFLILIYYGRVVIPHWIFRYLYVFGAIYLMYLAFAILKSRMPSKSRSGNYLVGLSMGVTNPFQILWWVTVGFFLIQELSLFSMLGFFLGITTWIVTFPLAMNRVGHLYSPTLKVFSFIILIIFAAIMLYESVVAFI